MKRIGLYPGTFDPLTNGHVDIIGRALKLVDKLVIGVAINEEKGPLFTLQERVGMVESECKNFGGDVEIEVRPFKSLLMHFAEEVGASMIIRGLRAVSDFEYEFQMALINRRLNLDIETVFLAASPATRMIASSLVKQIAKMGGDISLFIPKEAQAVMARALAGAAKPSH